MHSCLGLLWLTGFTWEWRIQARTPTALAAVGMIRITGYGPFHLGPNVSFQCLLMITKFSGQKLCGKWGGGLIINGSVGARGAPVPEIMLVGRKELLIIKFS